MAQFVIIVLGLEFFDPYFLAMVKAYRHAHTRIGPGFVLVQEIPTIIAYFAGLSGFARIERRRIRDYFLDGPRLRAVFARSSMVVSQNPLPLGRPRIPDAFSSVRGVDL